MIRRFNRFELKYIVRHSTKARLCEALQHNMRLDDHAGADGTYRLASLYFDSPDLSCFWAKEDGIRFRRKVRLRIYGQFLDDPNELVHAEIKQRMGKTVQKRRLTTRMQTALDWIDGVQQPALPDSSDQAVAEEIVMMSDSLQLRPACVTSYRREAWMGSDAEAGLRITFDSDVACRGPEALLGHGPPEILFVPPDAFVMEIKVNDTVPLWVTRLVAEHGCTLQRVSKYCEGIRTLKKRVTDG